jgi:hypothetical protein
MYKILRWREDLDLIEFYKLAEQKGFENNSSQTVMVDCFRKEKEWSVWILYYNDRPVGSVAAHSFPEMGNNAYRICARTCVFSDMVPLPTLRTKNQIVTHQHITSQFYIPICIEWAPKDSRLYITTNENSAGSQRLVHTIFAPAMAQSKQMKKIRDIIYRDTKQTVWELYPDQFYKHLNRYPRWQLYV